MSNRKRGYSVQFYRDGDGPRALGPFATEAEAIAARDAAWDSERDIWFAGLLDNRAPVASMYLRIKRP